MAGYFEEMGWSELQDGERPDHLLHIARFLLDFGLYEDNFSGEWPRSHCIFRKGLAFLSMYLPALPPPASKEAVQNLPDITIESDDKSCPICLKAFHKGDKVKQMPCEHVFHSTCILTWLGRTNSCPFCRLELPTDNETYEAFKKEKKRAEQRKEDLETLHDSMFS